MRNQERRGIFLYILRGIKASLSYCMSSGLVNEANESSVLNIIHIQRYYIICCVRIIPVQISGGIISAIRSKYVDCVSGTIKSVILVLND